MTATPTHSQSLKIVLDSNVFIFGLRLPDSVDSVLLDWLLTRTNSSKDVKVLVPSLVETEVRRNLDALAPELTRYFYRLLRDLSVQVSYADPPDELVLKYHRLGMAEEDGYIAAFVEWQGADYLISENRHFLKDLHTDAFEVLDADGFMRRATVLFEN